MIVAIKQNVTSAVTHAVCLKNDAPQFLYLFSGDGEWVYGHLAKLKLFATGRQVENIHIDEVPELLDLMAVREAESNEKYWLGLIEKVEENGVTGWNAEHEKHYILDASKLPMHETGPAGAYAAAEVAVDLTQIQDLDKADQYKLARKLYLNAIYEKVEVILTEEPHIINQRVLACEYNESTNTLSYWALGSEVAND